MMMMFYSHANKTHFHENGFALSFVLKARVFLELGNNVLEKTQKKKGDKSFLTQGGCHIVSFGIQKIIELLRLL